MNRTAVSRALGLAGLALLAGCADPDDPAINPKARHALEQRARMEVLFDGTDMEVWRAIRGKVDLEAGRMVLGGPGDKSTVLMDGRPHQDGVLEVDVQRRTGRGSSGPYTFGLRIGGGLLSWRSIYVICRPGRVQVCTGSATNWHPKPEQTVAVEPTDGPEHWRFVLDGHDIACFRSGRRLLTYHDAKPREGGLAITADDCAIEIRGVRYRPPERTAE